MSDVFDPSEPQERLKEKVTLSNGKHLWVWELMAADILRIGDRTAVPSGRGLAVGQQSDVVVWQVLHSCFESDQENAKPIFSEENILAIYRLKRQDLRAINRAIDRVNGMGAEEEAALANFTLPSEDGKLPSSPGGVSLVSAGSPVS